MKRLGLNRPLNDELIETLEEIETERNNLLLGEDIYNQPATKTKPKAPSHQNITTEDIDRIENITRADLQEAIAKSFQETMSRATKTLNNSKKSANKRGEDLIIRQFLSELLREKGNEAPGIDYDPVDDITDSMASMTLNSATINAIKSAVRSAVKKKCTKCGRFGHTSRKCSVKKKKKSKKSKKGKVNLAIEPDSDSDSSSENTPSSDSSDSDTSFSDSSDSDGVLDVHISKSKKK
ncbi:hypothetical protein RclHR1_15880008 [Rhizophagus clarus]|uniref:CCHC-type domain-containing protein n=1 Tax=Rhizophagus clarus TaxID=94130 RepID=A0A2Z6QGB8_9GLOM|nr:hypothetical protein RclHR1_15880008 [Rhizophagus clarus]